MRPLGVQRGAGGEWGILEIGEVLQVLTGSESDDEMRQDAEILNRCDAKRRGLVAKLKLLSWYKALARRNAGVARPANAIDVPVIILGLGNKDRVEVGRDGRVLEMKFGGKTPEVYSPVDVFKGIGFPEDVRCEMIREIPKLSPLSELVCEDEENVL